MICKCGYDGLSEIGSFPDDRFDGKYQNNPKMNIPHRCPKCKSVKNVKHINSIDSIRQALYQPDGRTVSFITGGADKNTVGYSIVNSKHWGCSSAISVKEYNNLIEEFKGKLHLEKITQDCDTALKNLRK